MNVFSIFRKPAHTELAELRDRLIVAETKAVARSSFVILLVAFLLV